MLESHDGYKNTLGDREGYFVWYCGTARVKLSRYTITARVAEGPLLNETARRPADELDEKRGAPRST